jgi:hypothetical protein
MTESLWTKVVCSGGIKAEGFQLPQGFGLKPQIDLNIYKSDYLE